MILIAYQAHLLHRSSLQTDHNPLLILIISQARLLQLEIVLQHHDLGRCPLAQEGIGLLIELGLCNLNLPLQIRNLLALLRDLLLPRERLLVNLIHRPTVLPSPSSSAIETPSSGGIKLKLKAPSKPPTPATEDAPLAASPPKKEKRKYTRKEKPDANGTPAPAKAPKKRARDGDSESPAAKRQAKDAPSIPLKLSLPRVDIPKTGSEHRPSITTLKLTARTPVTPKAITVKHRGRPPPRPLGVGYDSEADDVEEDPAIEQQFVLRMAPGEDCEYLRKAIQDRTIGLPAKEGGANVSMRFFDREGRRAVVTIRGRHYAATLVDLPCVIEGMKSWDKRGWWKSADICQMLLVIGQVPDEESAKMIQLPKEVDQSTWQYPHGLTPPMHYVRKRRFRKRVSYRTIEAVEEEVERLLEMDEQTKTEGGTTEYEIVDLNKLRDTNSQAGTEDEGYGMAEGESGYFNADEEDDDAAMAELMEQELGQASELESQAQTSAPTPSAEQAAATTNGTNTAALPTPSAGADSGDDESDEDDEDADGGAVDEIDEEALARQQEVAQQREEIADLEREIEIAKAQLDKQTNALLRQRAAAKVVMLQNDLELKKASLGDDKDE